MTIFVLQHPLLCVWIISSVITTTATTSSSSSSVFVAAAANHNTNKKDKDIIIHSCVNLNNGALRVLVVDDDNVDVVVGDKTAHKNKTMCNTAIAKTEKAVPLLLSPAAAMTTTTTTTTTMVVAADATTTTTTDNPIVDGSTVTITGDNTVSSTGDGQPISVMQPYISINYIIALEGIYPSHGDDEDEEEEDVNEVEVEQEAAMQDENEEDEDEEAKNKEGNDINHHHQQHQRRLQTDDPYIGEIRMFAGNFAPRGWALCNGALLSVNSDENQPLFSLIGTTYGGDGINTFRLPDLRGRVAVSSSRTLPQGVSGGKQAQFITDEQLTSHSHTISALTGTLTLN